MIVSIVEEIARPVSLKSKRETIGKKGAQQLSPIKTLSFRDNKRSLLIL